MRAIAVKAFKARPEVVEIPTPEPKEDEMLVRLSVAGVNPFDWKVADGAMSGQVMHTFPLVLGFDGAGTVAALGSRVKRFTVGDPVFGQFWHIPLGRGTYAQYCAVSEGAPIAKKPNNLSMEDAAALPTAGMTALDLLEKSGLKAGETVLIVGATGGVGQFLVQLARQRGLRVIATGTRTDVVMLKALGANTVVDFTTGSVSEQVAEDFPDGIDGFLDLASNPLGFADCAALVRKGGAALTTNYIADEKVLAAQGVRGGNFILAANSALVERLGTIAAAGELKIPIEKRIPFDQAISAIADSRNGERSRGKTVILI